MTVDSRIERTDRYGSYRLITNVVLTQFVAALQCCGVVVLQYGRFLEFDKSYKVTAMKNQSLVCERLLLHFSISIFCFILLTPPFHDYFPLPIYLCTGCFPHRDRTSECQSAGPSSGVRTYIHSSFFLLPSYFPFLSPLLSPFLLLSFFIFLFLFLLSI